MDVNYLFRIAALFLNPKIQLKLAIYILSFKMKLFKKNSNVTWLMKQYILPHEMMLFLEAPISQAIRLSYYQTKFFSFLFF